MPPETSQTLDRGLRVLRLVAGRQPALTVAEIAAELDLPRAVVYRLIAALEAHRLVQRTADGRCRLGVGILELAQQLLPILRSAATPVLRRLAEQVGATAHLTVVDAGQALAIAVVEPSWTAFHVAYRLGSRHELGHGAAGRAILAGRRPPADRDYVTSAGELQPGAHGVAAPVRGVAQLEASVGVVALVALDPGVAGPAVVTAAAEVSAAVR